MRAQKLVTDNDLTGDNVFAELAPLYLPSLFGKMPNRRFALYVPPEHREAVQIGRLVQSEEGGWTGLMGTRIRRVVAVFDPDRDRKLYAEYASAYEVRRCIRDFLKQQRPDDAGPAAEPSSASSTPTGASQPASP